MASWLTHLQLLLRRGALLCTAGLLACAGGQGTPLPPPQPAPGADAGVPDAGSPDTADAVHPGPGYPGPVIEGCAVFPLDNAWNQDVSRLPVHPDSERFIEAMGADGELVAAWGQLAEQYGVPITVVRGTQPRVPVEFRYEAHSDPGPYPIPDDVLREADKDPDADHHAIVLDRDRCWAYELYDLRRKADGGWFAQSGALWHLGVNWTRPEGYTSADAAGLPILPGLVRYEETEGELRHAIRITSHATQAGYIAPASHFSATSSSPFAPPMGLRLRLKASVDLSGYAPRMRVLLRALQRYGAIVADNGNSWRIGGTSDPRWSIPELHSLAGIHGSDFEVVQTGPIQR
ncbi:hypothetical protein FGE12_14685 [Aggregicoccus sp. 17bor-14]|uniref:hypothetical protein n=1 Tax=Myxococcaceae TaxID=31 RepID=UPI00129CAE50|nr:MULTISPECIES: hypothetical protein [Myxococcaceae]MBF5043640.1 hypothetical protein [Simulacricoccus sp. 17bor-14]MRI89399.1 hypothetical protein [Aggregicoccus sp. 17bor-14]